VAAVRHQPALTDGAPRHAQLRGVVTAFSGWKNSFFLQDSTGGISIDRKEQTPISVGDQVEVDGAISPGSFAPIVISDSVTRLGKGTLPAARVVAYEDAADGALDSQWIEMQGVVQSAQIGEIWGDSVLFLGLRTPGGMVTVHVVHFSQTGFSQLVDSTVRVRGVCGSVFNGRHQLVGIRIFTPDLSQVRVESPSVDLAQLPSTPLENLLQFNPDASRSHRVRTSGIVTFQSPGDLLYVQANGAGVCVRTHAAELFTPGTRVEVFGFLGAEGYSTALENATVRRLGAGSPPLPLQARAANMIVTANGFTDAPYDGLLVRIEGKLVERLPQAEGQLWLLEQDGIRFQAELGKAGKGSQIEPGSTVALVGICRTEADDHRNPKAFRILLRSTSDITVLRIGGSSASVSFLAVALAFVLGAGLLVWSLQGWDLAKTPMRRKTDQGMPLGFSHWTLVSKGISITVAAAGAVALAVWAIELRFAGAAPPDYLALNPAVAAALLAAGVALWLFNKTGNLAAPLKLVRMLCAALTAALGGLEVLQYVTGANSGKITMATAVVLFLLGSALLLLPYRRLTGVAQIATLLSAALCVLGLNSCMYGIHDFPGIAVYAAMGFFSALSLFLLSLGLLFASADRGPMRALSSQAPGGLMARRLLPCALLAPSVLGWVRWKIQLLGFYDTAFGLALFTSANALAFSSLIWTSASLLNRLNLSRERAERQIRDREEQFRTLLESAPDAMIMLSTEGKVQMVNTQAENLFGYSRQEILSKNVDWLIPDPFRQQITACWNDAACQTMQVGGDEGDIRARRKDGSEFSVEISLSPIRSGRGQLIIATVRDVTIRKQVEAQLQQSAALYKTTVESLPQIVWTCFPDGRSDFTSPRWREFTGLPYERHLEEDAWADHIHPEDLERATRDWYHSLNTGERLDSEFRMCNFAGDYRWFRVMAIPMRDANGRIVRWFGSSTDVEDYKRAEAEIRSFNETLEARVAERTAELRDSEERFRSIIDGVKDYSIIALDAAGNITSWNSGATRQKGYSADEILGKHFSVFYTPLDRDTNQPAQDLAAALRDGETSREGWRVRKNGSRFWANVLLTAVRQEDGTLRGFSKITRDASERKRAENLLQSRNAQLAEMNAELSVQTQRAEQAARAKSEFLAAMSHEIRTPMNAILAMAEILWESDLKPEQRELVEVFRRNGRSLLTLINDILDFSKIESGQLELESITFDLRRLVRHSTDMAKIAAQAKGVAVTTEVAPDVSPYVVGDPTRLRQIILNLLNNAVKFTSQGRVSLTVTRAEQDGLIEFAVADTGIGIPADKLAHIFDKFTQADSSTTRKFGGTGLGLSISKSLAECMGGRIWVTSIAGQGSTFRFTVKLQPTETAPAVEEEAPVMPSGSPGDPEEKPLRILVAEDTADNRLVVQLYMKGLPHSLTFAEDGDQALKLFSAQAFDLVLMDLQMPVLDGLSATRAIRALEAQRGVKPTPIVAVSADAGENDKARSLAAGCTDHFAKPISLRKFLSVIRKYSYPSAAPPPLPEETPAAKGVLAGMKKLVPGYLKSRRKDAEKLEKLAAASDFVKIRALAHQMKGSGTTYGFPDLTNLAAALEAAADRKDEAAVGLHTKEISSFIQSAKAPE
jgi:PAS domain S-box-containing protein